MKRLYKNLLLAAALVAPAMSWAALSGSGTEADPYLLGTSADLLEMRSVLVSGKITHFKLTADINMKDVTSWIPLNSFYDEKQAAAEGATAEEIAANKAIAPAAGEEYTKYIGLDGDGHIISNLVCRVDQDQYREARGWYYKSFFGVLAGYCRNIGFQSCVMVDNQMGGGLLGGYLGHSKYQAAGLPETVVENCYFTFTVKETARKYCGGVFGSVESPSIFKDNYVSGSVFGTYGGPCGAVFGRLNNTLTVENVVLPYGSQVNTMNYGAATAEEQAKLKADPENLPFPNAGIVFATRGTKGKASIKNLFCVYASIKGKFSEEGDCIATPFGPINEDVDSLEIETVKVSPWTLYVGATTIADGAFVEAKGVDMQTANGAAYKPFCYSSYGEINQIAARMAKGGYMAPSYLGLGIYSTPRWYAGRTMFNGGTGTAENPFLISTTAQLGNMYAVTTASYVANFKLLNDLEYSGSHQFMPALGWDGMNYSASLNFDGNCKVIKGFNPSVQPYIDGGKTNDAYNSKMFYYQSLFGIFSGTVKNLGVTDAYVVGLDRADTGGLTDGAGVLCAYAGHSNAPGVGAKFENCFVSGVVTSSAYAGGFFGTTGGDSNTKIVVNNCWSDVSMQGTYVGGIGGRVDNDMDITNVVTRGAEIFGTENAKLAAGLICVRNADPKKVIINNAICWVGQIVPTNEDAEAAAICAPEGNCTASNTYVWNGTEIDGVAVKNGVSAAELLKTAQTWSGYSSTKNNEGYPMLKWEAGESGAVDVVWGDEVAEAVAVGGEGVIYVNGASVIYNLNGQVVYSGADETVAVPAGVYVVKVAGKASKVAVK